MMNEVLIRSAFKRFVSKMTLNNLMVFLGPVVNGIVISRYLGTDAMAAYQIVRLAFDVCGDDVQPDYFAGRAKQLRKEFGGGT